MAVSPRRRQECPRRSRGEAAEEKRPRNDKAELSLVVHEGVSSPMPPRVLQTSQPLRSNRPTKPVFMAKTATGPYPSLNSTRSGGAGAALR